MPEGLGYVFHNRDEEQIRLMKFDPGWWNDLFQELEKGKESCLLSMAGVCWMNAWKVTSAMGVRSGEYLDVHWCSFSAVAFGWGKEIELGDTANRGVLAWKGGESKWAHGAHRLGLFTTVFTMVGNHKIHFLIGGSWGRARGGFVPCW